MKRVFLMLMMAAVAASSVKAQRALIESKTTDNWYIGLRGGYDTKTTHTDLKQSKNYNPMGGLRIGHYFNPVIGMAVEGDLLFRDNGYASSRTFVKAINGNLLGTVNFSNWFGGYPGTARRFEFVGILGMGVKHDFATEQEKKNFLTSKLGMDLTFNLGRKRAWQFYLEPAIYYLLEPTKKVKFDVNYSALQLSLGFNYKFGNSNGTHNFKYGQLRDQIEIDDLNILISELREENDGKDRQLARYGRRISELEDSLEAARNVKPTVVQRTVVNKVVNNNVLQPTVIFGLGKSTVDAAQMASVAMIAKYMKNHPESHILIKGYASPEGNPELNQRLSENRASAVKNVLVNRYGIAESRLTVQGMGATDELFDEIDFNRVATFTDTTK